MRTPLIIFIFSVAAIYIAQTLMKIQLSPVRLRAFVSITLFSVSLIIQPQIAMYLIIGSVSFYNPRYWWQYARLHLHQWIILASLLLLAGQYIHQRKKFALHRLDLIMGLFILSFCFSLINSPAPDLGVKYILYALTLVSGCFLLRLAVTTEKQLTGIVLFFIACAAANSMISYTKPTVGHRVSSLVLQNPNALGDFLALILPLSLGLIFYGSLSPLKKKLTVIAALAITASIVLTFSRSSWAGSAVGLLVLGLFRPRLKYFSVIILAGVLLISIPAVRRRLIEDRTDPGVIYRRAKIKTAYQLFKLSPILGMGPGSFQSLAPEAEHWGIRAHSSVENLYMQILAEGGLVQAFIFVALVIWITSLGVTTVRALPTGSLQAIAMGGLAGFWVFLGIGAGETLLCYPLLNWIVGFHIGIILKTRELSGLVKS